MTIETVEASRGEPATRGSLGVYLNESADGSLGYREGDELRWVVGYEMEGPLQPPKILADDALRQILADDALRLLGGPLESLDADAHSVPELALAALYWRGANRPLSVGDVVVVGEVALAVERDGWKRVTISAEQVRTGLPHGRRAARSLVDTPAPSPDPREAAL